MRASARVAAALKDSGILLLQDPSLPSVTTLVAGSSLRGSWWGHPKGREIWAVLSRLEHDKDIVFVKLVSRKVTLVHRRLWPALYAAASDGDGRPRGLSKTAETLLARVRRAGDERASGPAAKELEERLLVYSEEEHTPSGSHAKRLMTWGRWAKKTGVATRSMSPAEGRRLLEDTVADLNARFGAQGRLPWSGPSRLIASAGRPRAAATPAR